MLFVMPRKMQNVARGFLLFGLRRSWSMFWAGRTAHRRGEDIPYLDDGPDPDDEYRAALALLGLPPGWRYERRQLQHAMRQAARGKRGVALVPVLEAVIVIFERCRAGGAGLPALRG